MRAKVLMLLMFLTSASTHSQYITEYKTGMFSAGAYNWLYNTAIYNDLTDLQVNQVIKYTFHRDFDDQYHLEGGFFDALTGYNGNVSSVVTALASNNQQVLLEREKIVRPAYGQQSDYEAEITNPSSYYPGYGWSTHSTGTSYGPDIYGAMGYRCSAGINPAGYVLENLYENGEQINSPGQGLLQQWDIYNHQYYLSDNKLTPNNDWKWYVLPRMRISTADAFGTSQPVVTIEVRNYQHNLISSVIISTDNFRNPDSINEYDGRYLDEFTAPINYITIFAADLNQGNNSLTDGRSENPDASQVDYKVFWHGEVDVWIDRVRVEDEWAHFLFDTSISNPYYFIPKIVEETTGLTNAPFFFYQDEFQYNMVPCIAKVNQLIRAENSSNGLVSLVNDFWWSRSSGLKNPPADFSNYVDKVDPPALMVSAYPFDDYVKLPPGVTMPITSTFPGTQNYVQANTNDEYNASLQYQLDNGYHLTKADGFCSDIDLPSYTGRIKKAASSVAGTNVPFIFNSQVHAYEEDWKGRDSLGCKPFVSRDQTAPEMGLMPYLALCYGAKQISYWWLPSFPLEQGFHNWGLLEETDWGNTPAPRYTNYYDEPKWNNLIALNRRLNVLGDAMFALNFSGAYSVHTQGVDHEIVNNILSIDPHLIGPNYCLNDNGLAASYPDFVECPEQSFWEMGFFAGERYNRYFMMVNRRCAPEAGAFLADDRVLKIKFEADQLPGSWKNWQLSEVGGSTRPINFSRNGGYVNMGTTPGNMGWFKPGEGKLFKITPTFETGGDLVCDEVISGETFTCEDTIFSNGYNITIGAGTTMKFTDSSCIVMNGGVFTMGDQQVPGSQNITFDAASGSSWRGHSFTGTEVHIYGASFTGLANDSVYALNMINCPIVDIRGTVFNSAGTLKGGINAVYYADPMGGTPNINFYTGGNTFTATGSTIPTVIVSSFAGVTTPLIIENNTFTNGNTAIFLSGITGGAVKNNNISENYTGISLLSSYIDVSGNTISSTVNGSTGIFAAGGSEVKMNPAGPKKFGGMNSISNEGTGTNNIKVESSYFLTDGGQNVFNISDITTSYHLYGYFPSFISVPDDETVNCFKVSGSPTNTPYNLVTDGYQGSQISFNFYPLLTGCDPEQGDNMMVLNLGDGINDTIYSNGSGSGGSQSSALPLSKGEYSRATGREGVYYKQTTPSVVRRGAFTSPNVNTAYDSICMLMRSRSYSAARTKCLEMIGNYPDSIHSLNALAKLYLASVSSNANITDLKVFYENLILNHPNNTSLVKRANYYILKCKVRLHEYTSALAGFQQIINENPYSYEGLIAKWDYMATSLLVPQAGSFGSEPTVSVLDENSSVSIDIVNALQKEADLPQSEIRDPNSSDDKSPFTKEQRIDIRKSINTAIENDKNDNDRKIRILETKSDQGDVNAIKELAQVKALKQVVKTEKPRSITEHIKLVSEDIQKVFGNVTGGKGKDMSNIPTVYRLSQNYPNPFNPVTKINYDLPKDAKVNIVIYDILGREVKRLVNNELKTAGTYIIDFNASNYASGVYFYRIEAEEPGGNKFVDSKKMVLIK